MLNGRDAVADFAFLNPQRLAGFERDGGNAGVGGRAAQRTDGAAVVQNHRRSEPARQIHDVEICQIAAHLREVGAVKRTGVDVDEIVAGLDHVFEQRVREPRGRAALFLSGK